MGCTDSQVKKPDEPKIQSKKHIQQNPVLPSVDQDEVNQFIRSPQVKKQDKIKSKKNVKIAIQTHQEDQNLPEITEKPPQLKTNKSFRKRSRKQDYSEEEMLRIRKANQLINRANYDQQVALNAFKNKRRLKTQHPDIPTYGKHFIKPVVQYSPLVKKCAILPQQNELQVINRWQKLITQKSCLSPQVNVNNSYISVNQSSKTSFRKKQIQDRLEHIRNGRYEQSQSGQLFRIYANKYESDQIENHNTIYL